ncbi:MAG: cytochrome c peroxidase [Akkermansia sp.]
MNKLCSFTKSVVVAGAVIVVTAGVSPFLLPGSSDLKDLSEDQINQLVEKTFQTKCADCHKPGQTIPGLMNSLSGGLIQRDIDNAIRMFNMNTPYSLATLSKIEHSLEAGTMPPPAYTAVHWGTTMSGLEKAAMLQWVKNERAKSTIAQLVDAAFATQSIQPVPDQLAVNQKKATVGELLFNDKRLSNDNTVACSTCHLLTKGGTDNLPVSVGVRGQKGGINAPTVFNAVFHTIQFWDGRAKNLQEQAGGPPLNPVEMGYTHPSDWSKIIDKLKADPELTAKFMKAYPQGYSAETITNAIAEYEKTLITPNSPFDKFLKGDSNAISAEAKEGYALFMKYGCQMCHTGVALGGQSFEFADLKGDFFEGRSMTNDDKGRMNFTKNKGDIHKFRVPTLRNVALTWPYMHDASAKNLHEAVVKMFRYQIGDKAPNKTDVNKIVSFLRTLTGELNGKPLQGQPVADAK